METSENLFLENTLQWGRVRERGTAAAKTKKKYFKWFPLQWGRVATNAEGVLV
jgi:hypothetical protein